MEKFHKDYGSRNYRNLKPGESLESRHEVEAARRYMTYRRNRGLPFQFYEISGNRVSIPSVNQKEDA